MVAIFGGNTRQHLTSRQVVQGMLECGADVHVINRKRLMHAKSYGSKTRDGEMLVVTSGNFTGPGMSQNVEMSLLLDRPTTRELGFSWDDMIAGMLSQRWEFYQPKLDDMTAPVWQLLYDEQASTILLDETDEVTLVLRLGHADTVRINAVPGTKESKGTLYFWLSKDCYDFFPALTIPNRRGRKKSYSCKVRMDFVDLRKETDVRVTFEAENNLDFRLGTGPLRHTGISSIRRYRSDFPNRRVPIRTASLSARYRNRQVTCPVRRQLHRPARQKVWFHLQSTVPDGNALTNIQWRVCDSNGTILDVKGPSHLVVESATGAVAVGGWG